MKLFDAYRQQVEDAHQAKKISQTCYESLIKRTTDDLDNHLSELVYSLEHADYYKILDRIDKAVTVIAEEKDIAKKDRYIKKMNELIEQMNELIPK